MRRATSTVAARWLLDNSWSGQSEVAVLGPEDISFNDMSAIISDVLGKAVTYQQIGFDAYKARFVEIGLSDAMAQGMTDMARAKDQGLDLAVSRNPENTTPTDFRTWCEDAFAATTLGGRGR
ncbi:MAG: hypothetical protein SV862_09805 [Pseudomonadota bacterium]|nr:hypothetical protein [Pseudomonadota bacterium]